jgi:tetraacyldisaccharide 4'-kinase
MHIFRFLLYPFAMIYCGVTDLRNWLYDKGYKKSRKFDFPIICVGNLTVGGTGKTPFIEYLTRLLAPFTPS